MKSGIELLPKRRKEEKEKRIEKLNRGLLVILLIYIAIISGLLGGVFYTSRQISQVQAQQKTLETKIRQQEKKENLAVLLKDRVSKEVLYYKEKVDYKGIFEVVNALTPEGVLLNEAEIGENSLSLSGETTNISSLKSFLDQLNEQLIKFSFVKLLQVARTRNGGYSFSVETILALSK